MKFDSPFLQAQFERSILKSYAFADLGRKEGMRRLSVSYFEFLGLLEKHKIQIYSLPDDEVEEMAKSMNRALNSVTNCPK